MDKVFQLGIIDKIHKPETCPRCGKFLEVGQQAAQVQHQPVIQWGFYKKDTVHFYQLGETYHQKCIGFGGRNG